MAIVQCFLCFASVQILDFPEEGGLGGGKPPYLLCKDCRSIVFSRKATDKKIRALLKVRGSFIKKTNWKQITALARFRQLSRNKQCSKDTHGGDHNKKQ